MEKLKHDWLQFFQSDRQTNTWWNRKQELFQQRGASIVKISGQGHAFEEIRLAGQTVGHYWLHLTFLIKQKQYFFQEEQVLPFEVRWVNGYVTAHKMMAWPQIADKAVLESASLRDSTGERFSYDRRAAVRYAERWWNSYNPEYRQFDVDCTNYVSQCMRAGGAPMREAPERDKGWWYQEDNWSYSWAVAHSLRWYLSGSASGLKGKEMESAHDLLAGDIICYDFAGDGRWDHNTIVVAHDARGMPLVNAHTDNSRNRYWSYKDSPAWTQDIQYKFFRIE